MVFMWSPRKRSLKLRKCPKWVEKRGNKYWNSKMHIWECVCVCLLVYVPIQAAASAVCAFKCKAPPINTVMSLHILTKQHNAPKTHYLQFQVCLLHSFTENGLIEKPLWAYYNSLWRIAVISLFSKTGGEKVNGFRQDALDTGCEIGFPGLTAIFSINYAERPTLLFLNMEDPCCDYGKLRFISAFGGSIFLPFLLYKLFFLNILSWSKCGLHKVMTWE